MTNPFSAMWHEVRYAFDRTFKTGERRSEFEYKYRRHGDYFGYRTNPDELKKYERTLQLLLEWRRGSESALEIGCSIGVFTSMIADKFKRVTAVDIANEALSIAAGQVGGAGDVSFVQGDLISLSLPQTFNVIVCGEVLMYVREKDGAKACASLERLLAPNGIIIEVSQADRPAGGTKFFQGWDQVLGRYFEIQHRQTFSDLDRPYEIVGYARRA